MVRVIPTRPFEANSTADPTKFSSPTNTIDEDIPFPDGSSSLLCLDDHSKLRLACYRLICNKIFQIFILGCIIINSILLAVDQPKFTNPKQLDTFLHAMEILFTSIFVLEFLLKVVALGFVGHKNAYLRSGWNILDFLIVATSVVSLSGSIGNYSALRVFRVLRPLRSVSRIKKLKNLIGGLFKALPMVLDNIIFLIFIMMLFAIAAVQFWVGTLNRRCYINEFPNVSSTMNGSGSSSNMTSSSSSSSLGMFNSSVLNNVVAAGSNTSSSPSTAPTAGNPFEGVETPFLVKSNTRSRPCGGLNMCGPITASNGAVLNSVCEEHEDKYFEKYMNYNNIGTAGFLLLKVIVLDNWPDNLMDAMDVSGRWSASIFFILLTLVASYFCVNLFLAILTLGYTTHAHENESSRRSAAQAAHAHEISVSRQRHKLQDLVGEYMDCGIQCDVDHDVMHTVRKAGYIDDAYRERKRIAAEEAEVAAEEKRSELISDQLASQQSGTWGASTSKRKDSGFSLHTEDSYSGPPIRKGSNSTQPGGYSSAAFAQSTSISRSTLSQPSSTPVGGSINPSERPNSTSLRSSDESGSFRGDKAVAKGATRGRRVTFAPATPLLSSDLPPPLISPRDGSGNSTSMTSSHGDSSNGPPALIKGAKRRSLTAPVLVDNSATNSSGGGLVNGVFVPSFDDLKELENYDDSTSRANTNRPERGDGFSSAIMSGEEQSFSTRSKLASSTGPLSINSGDPTGKYGASHRSVGSTYDEMMNNGSPIGDDDYDYFDFPNDDDIDDVNEDEYYLDEEEEEEHRDQLTFQELLEKQGIWGALAALEQTMDPIENDLRPLWKIKLGEAVESKPVGLFILFVSLVNVAVLSVDYYGIDPELAKALGATSVACTICFALQLALKVVAWGFTLTFSKTLNVFDLIMVLLAIPDIYFSGGASSSFSIIRAFRMIRVVRILRNFQSLQAITETILGSWSSVGYLSLLILLALYIYAIMGMQLFGLKYGRGFEHRENFDSLWESLLTCFIVVTGDNWTDMMVLSMRSGKEEEITSIIYFTSLYMIGNYILINLFVAIIIDKLSAKMEELEENDDVLPTLILPVYHPSPKDLANAGTSKGTSFDQSTASYGGLNSSASDSRAAGGFVDDLTSKENSFSARCQRISAIIFRVEPIKVVEDSLYLFSPQNEFRKVLLKIIGSTLFQWFITASVLGGMIFLCFESANNSPETNLILDRANFVFTAIFWIEMIMKIVAFGLFYPLKETDPTVPDPHQPAYFRDPWNWVDAVINVLSMVALRFTLFKSSRSLRTIRLTIRNEKTKLIIVAMLQAIPHVLQGLLFVSFLFYVLGIMGVQLFKGEYYHCNDENISSRTDCIGNYTVTVQGPVVTYTEERRRSWDRLPYHFDHLGASVLSLFVVAVGDGWSDIMFQGMDTTRPEHGPRLNNEPWNAFYFIVVYICCNFFSFNMIIGILINYFSKMKKLNDGSALLTPDQRLYVKARHTIDNIMFNDDLIPLDPRICQFLGRVLKYRYKSSSGQQAGSNSVPVFDLVMTVVIVINTAVIASTHKDMADWEHLMQEAVNQVSLGIFAIEMLMKLVAYGPKQYFSVAWNRFDSAIVVAGYAAFGLNINSLSFVRVLRVIKLVKRSGIEQLLSNVIRSFNSFVNVLVLVILTFFIYAVAGVILWGNVKRNGVLTDVNNFDNVPNAMLVLYQIATTEGWAEYMTACSLEKPNCQDTDYGDNCGHQAASTAFFLSFMVVCAFTILQLFVAVVVEIFTDDFNHEDPVVLGFEELKEVWTTQIGAGVNIITIHQLVEVLPSFPIILTDLSYQYRPGDMIRLLSCLHLPVDSKYRITYRDLVHALAWRKYHIDVRSIGATLNDAFFNLFTSSFFDSFTVAEAYAAMLIQKRWAAHKQHLYEQNMILMRMAKNKGDKKPRNPGKRVRLGAKRGKPLVGITDESSTPLEGSQQTESFTTRLASDGDGWYKDDSEPGSFKDENEMSGAAAPIVGAMFAPQPMFLQFADLQEPTPGSTGKNKFDDARRGSQSMSNKSHSESNSGSREPPVVSANPLGVPSSSTSSPPRSPNTFNIPELAPRDSPFSPTSTNNNNEDFETDVPVRGTYGLRSMRNKNRRRGSAAHVMMEMGDMMERGSPRTNDQERQAPQGAVYVPGCSLYSFIPLVDERGRNNNFATSTIGGVAGASSMLAPQQSINPGDFTESFGAPPGMAPDPTGIFNPDLE